MNQETSLVLRQISLVENQSLESAGEAITQLHLAGGLSKGQMTNEEMLNNLDLQLAQQPGDTTDKHFVFQGQCLILGDSGVGKTSLVKSLKGQSFDSNQPKTQGIDEILVDQNWKNLAVKDLIFGNMWWFCQQLRVQLTLYGPSEHSNIIVRSLDKWNNCHMLALCAIGLYFLLLGPFLSPLLVLVLVSYTVFFYFFHFNCTFRLLVTTFTFAIKSRGLMIGTFLAFMSVCYCYGKFDMSANGKFQIHILLITITALFVIVAAINVCFGIEYPRQLKFKYNRPLVFVCFMPLLTSVLVGYFCTLAVSLLVNTCIKCFGRSIKEPDELVTAVTTICVLFCIFSLGKSAVRFTNVITNKLHVSRGIYKTVLTRCILAIILLCFILVFGVGMLIDYDCSLFLLFIIDTIRNEWQNNESIRNVQGSKVFTAVLIEKQELDEKKLKTALKKFSSLKLKILDFAGDKEYYDYHQMFLRMQAIYVIVFNMASFAENGFGDIDTKVKRIQFWLESICSHVPHNTPMVLVGTHRGNIDNNCVCELDDHLKRNLWNTFRDVLVVNDDENLIFFPVENSNGNKDTGIQALQKKIMSVVEECKETIGQEIPFSWIRIQDAIISIQGNKDAKFCVTLKELPRAIDNLVPSTCKWSKETLKYFHDKGLVIYLDRNQDLDLSNWILLKPQILVDIFIQLVTPPPKNTQQRGLRRAWDLLQQKGMLTNSLLRNIISKVQENKEAITAFLEEYDVICPLINTKVKMCNPHEENEEQPTHFVPSLLPMSSDGDVPVWHDGDTDKKFYIFFKRFLPEPMFHRLLSRAHKSSKVEFLNGQTVVFRDAGKFWMRSSLPYMLKLMRKEKMIEVTFRCR